MHVKYMQILIRNWSIKAPMEGIRLAGCCLTDVPDFVVPGLLMIPQLVTTKRTLLYRKITGSLGSVPCPAPAL